MTGQKNIVAAIARGWSGHVFEHPDTLQADLQKKRHKCSDANMTESFIGHEIEPQLDWLELIAAIGAGHRLAKATITDSFLYRGKDTLLSRAAWIDGLGSLVKTATIFPENAAHGLANVNGAVALFADATGVLEAMLDFHLVTKMENRR